MTSKFVEIVSPSYHQRNCIPIAAIRWHDSGNRPPYGRPFARIFRHPDALLPSFFASPWISPAYAGAGLGRRSSIRLRIFRNKLLGTAISASWNVMYRPWRPTLAPILTSFSRSVQRPMLCLLRQSQRPHEVGQIVGQGVKLEPNGIVAELAARHPPTFVLASSPGC